MRFRGFGSTLVKTQAEIEFPFLLNPTTYTINTSVANSGNNDLYTVGTGKRAFIAASRIFFNGTAVAYLMVKRGGTYYQLSVTTSLGVVNTALASGFVFEAGDIIAFNHSTADAVNYNLGLILFDAPASGPRGLKTYLETAPISGNTTLCTVAANCTMQFPGFSTGGGMQLTGGGTIAMLYNGSGSSRGINGYIVPSGSSADATTQFFAGSTNDGTRATLTPSGYMAAGTAFIMSTNSATTQQNMWATTFEF